MDGVEALEEGMQAVFRRTCELYDSALYMRGDSINKRYTAYRKAKMKTFYSDGKEPSDAEAREARAARAASTDCGIDVGRVAAAAEPSGAFGCATRIRLITLSTFFPASLCSTRCANSRSQHALFTSETPMSASADM